MGPVRVRARRGADTRTHAGKGEGTGVGRKGRRVRRRRISSFSPWKAVQHESMVYPYRKTCVFFTQCCSLGCLLASLDKQQCRQRVRRSRRQAWLRGS